MFGKEVVYAFILVWGLSLLHLTTRLVANAAESGFDELMQRRKPPGLRSAGSSSCDFSFPASVKGWLFYVMVMTAYISVYFSIVDVIL